MRLSFSNSQQFTAFLISILLGAVFCVVYDCIRVMLRKHNSGGVVVFLADVLFFCAIGTVTFVFFLLFFKGMIRIYIFLGEALGFIVFRFTLSSLFRGLLEGCAMLVSKIIKALIFPLNKLLILIKKRSNKVLVLFRKKAKSILRTVRKKWSKSSKDNKKIESKAKIKKKVH